MLLQWYLRIMIIETSIVFNLCQSYTDDDVDDHHHNTLATCINLLTALSFTFEINSSTNIQIHWRHRVINKQQYL